jgi:hypothetical protein
MWKQMSSLVAIVTFSCALLSGCRPPPLMSYPWFWDFTKTKPKEADIAGTYKFLKLRLPSELERAVREEDASITLLTDHTAMLANVPEFDDFGQKLVCRLAGSANWDLDDQTSGAGGWSVMFRDYRPATTPTVNECKLENSLWSISVLSRHAPYRLYAIVGDPDSDTGVEVQRVSP